MSKPARRTGKSIRTTRPPAGAAVKTSRRVTLSVVVRYDNPGQLTIPNPLSLGDDRKLYLTRSGEAEEPKGEQQSISLKESVAWFRVGNDCHLRVTQGDSFSGWLKRIEQALP